MVTKINKYDFSFIKFEFLLNTSIWIYILNCSMYFTYYLPSILRVIDQIKRILEYKCPICKPKLDGRE